MKVETFVEILGADYFTGVPDSQTGRSRPGGWTRSTT